MKKQWNKPELKSINFEKTNETVVDCPMDIESEPIEMNCPSNNNPNNADLTCNYPGCNHKRHKKSKPEGRCKCHEGLVIAQS